MPQYLILKLSIPPFICNMVAFNASKGYRIIEKNWEGCWKTPDRPHCANHSAKQSCSDVKIGVSPSLFYCQWAISQSSTACHTSFKRGDSGLPADVKIRTIFQLIGILWSYFWEYLDINVSISVSVSIKMYLDIRYI